MHPAAIQAPLPPRSLWLMRLPAGTHQHNHPISAPGEPRLVTHLESVP